MTAWKTVRVRAALLERVKARAESEDTNATAWIERTLDAALGNVGGNTPDPALPHGGQSAPAPRRASVDGVTVTLHGEPLGKFEEFGGHASSAQAKRDVKPIPKGGK